MGARAAFTSGTFLALAVTSAWSYTAVLTIGPVPPLHPGPGLGGDYAALAAAPTGNGAALFAVTAAAYFTCFMISGLRRIRRRARTEAAWREGER
jgi:hypothetical protein